jgi:polysaccharide transporter, PST family
LNSNHHNVIVNVSWLLFDKAFKILLSIAVLTSVAKYLGTTQYGLLNYCITYAAIFNPLSTLGLDNLAVRDLVVEDNKNKIFATTFWLRVGGSLVYIIFTVAMSYIFQKENIKIQIISVLALSSIFRPFDVIDFWFQSQVNSKYSVAGKSFSYALISFFKIFLVYSAAPLISFAWAMLFESFLASSALLVTYLLKYNSIKLFDWDWQVGKKMLRESWPLIFSGFAIFTYMKIDQLMLGSMIGNQAVGIYSVAANISEIWNVIPTIIISSIAPAVYAAKKGNEANYYRRIEQLHSILVQISLLIAILVSFGSEKIVLALFGNSYAESASVLIVHVWSNVFSFMGSATVFWYIAEGMTELVTLRTIYGGVLNILLNFYLIPLYGAVGAAIATVVSYVFVGYIMNFFNYRTRKIFFIQSRSFLPWNLVSIDKNIT